MIMLRVHPNFSDEPAAYLTEYPKQKKDETVFDFSLVFEDYLMLQALVMDICQTFGEKTVQDIFLARLYYSNWIKKRTYQERKLKPHLYTAEKFVDTIMQHFNKFDSPYQQTIRDAEAKPKVTTLVKPTSTYVKKKPFIKNLKHNSILGSYGMYLPLLIRNLIQTIHLMRKLLLLPTARANLLPLEVSVRVY